jgi:hypothetical protein
VHTRASQSVVGLVALFALLSSPSGAHARDLEDLLLNLSTGVGISSSVDCFTGLCSEDGVNLSASLENFSETNAQIVNNRIVPLSSSVSGFTYDYNEDLDIYERSTRTFGPLFSERARTLGKGRSMLGLSHSTLSFDEFEGDSISSLSVSSVQGSLGTEAQVPGSFVSSTNPSFDSIIDLDIDESVTTAYYTYGVTDRLDLGVVLPLIRLDIQARTLETTQSQSADGQIPDCGPELPIYPETTCQFLTTQGGSRRVSDDYMGIGDAIVRAKWNFLSQRTALAGFLSATIPTGSSDNLTGLHTMTFTPGMVVSRDFDTSIGGFGVEAMLGYEIRPDEGNLSEWEWGAGVAYQPFSRASFAVDILGSEEAANSEFGDSLLDASLGAKFQLTSGVLLDLNVIMPLNDQGLRPNAIYSAQLEWVFGD